MRSLLIAFAILLALPTAALASGDDVIRDCTDDEVIQGDYTQQEYRDALANITADVEEYYDCRRTIQRAQLAAIGGGKGSQGGGGGGGGGAASGILGGGSGPAGGATAGTDPLAGASPRERAGIDRARRSGDASGPIELGDGTSVDVSRAGAAPNVTSVGDLPVPVIVLLALLAAGALGFAATRGRSLVLSRRA